MSFQMVLLLLCCSKLRKLGFGTMSFQMVLLPVCADNGKAAGFGTMSFQMVLLLLCGFLSRRLVLELCHSRWFYYCQSMQRLPNPVLELCHSRWFYYYQADGIPASVVLEPCHSRWFYYYMTRQLQRLRSWEIRAARRRRLRA